MGRLLSTVTVAVLLGLVGGLYAPGDAQAAYNSKSTSCGTRICYSVTESGIDPPSTYIARGRSSASISTAQFFAWTRGTNKYHIGMFLDQQACQVQNETSCYTPYLYLCDTAPEPAGCGSGSDNIYKWYATTWSWLKPATIEYALFTGTRLGVDSAYCWNHPVCA